MTEMAQAYAALRCRAEQQFGSQLSYAFVSGSSLYGSTSQQESDIDITIVLEQGMRDADIWSMVTSFIKDYVEIHAQLGLKPDLEFPGEYVSTSQLLDAAAGRGFHTDGQKLFLPPLYPGYFEENIEYSFRIWMSMIAFSFFLTGNLSEYLSVKIQALTTTVLYLLSHQAEETVTAESILHTLLHNKKSQQEFGITAEYTTLPRHEDHFFHLVFHHLEQSGFLIQSAGNTFSIQQDLVRVWHQQLISSLQTETVRRTAPLLNQEEQVALGIYAQNIYQTLQLDINQTSSE